MTENNDTITRIKNLATDFLTQQHIPSTEGKCAEMAKLFSEYLNTKNIQNKIIDARNYRGNLKTVGDSNHVLAAIDGIYVDFTASQFSTLAKPIVLGTVDSLKKDWSIVNSYNNFQDFMTNFSYKQK